MSLVDRPTAQGLTKGKPASFDKDSGPLVNGVNAEYAAAVQEGLTVALPIALREAEDEVASSVAEHIEMDGIADLVKSDQITAGQLVSAITELIVASLGSAATTAATLLTRKLAEQGLTERPNWLRDAVQASTTSKLATLTDFSNNRNQYVKEVEDGSAVFLTRHGTVVAALLPVAPGQYEQEVYAAAARRLLAERAAKPAVLLSPEQVADIAVRGAEAAEEFGIDTSGWQRTGPDPELAVPQTVAEVAAVAEVAGGARVAEPAD